MHLRSKTSLALLVASVLSACGDGAPPQAAAPQPAAQNTADPAVVRLYGQTCRACHDPMARTGAPATGNREAWAPRVAQGMDVLLERTISGYKGMPPLGACMDCSEDDFVALIRFMAGE